jgi:hypothetical protein
MTLTESIARIVADRVAVQAGCGGNTGVALGVSSFHGELYYVLWRIDDLGLISSEHLCCSCTDEARLLAHAEGFIENHRRELELANN